VHADLPAFEDRLWDTAAELRANSCLKASGYPHPSRSSSSPIAMGNSGESIVCAWVVQGSLDR